ncbi:MAG: lamin tail domain-containing protein [Gemmatimonadaceae bacterium]|nr:lamin tail domain-containing protein [Gemmatimonadaceae bacterium]
MIPAGTTIPANGLLVLDEAQFGFGLGSADAVRLFRANGTTLVDSYAWTAHAATTYGRCPDGSGGFATTAASTKGTPNICAAGSTAVKVNEVESNGGVPGDWVELYNTSDAPVDLAGYVFRDNDNTRGYTLPMGTVIPARGFVVLEEAQFGFGLGGADQARLFAPGGSELLDSYEWTSHATITYVRCPDGTGAFRSSTSSTKGLPNDCALPVRLNEVESNGGVPGDWVEFFNAGSTPVDLSGYVFRDNNDAAGYVLPAGTSIPGNGYLVLDEAQFGFGLGGADAARLFAPDGTTLVDSYSWTAHATTTYGRCPNGNGPFATTTTSTKGAVNACVGDLVVSPWPGEQSIRTADAGNVFGSNMSGLSYQPLAGLSTGVVWAVRNGPGTLFRLTYINGVWTPGATRTWVTGKALRYPDGTGDVDAEGVAAVGSRVYVAAERNNAANGVSRNSILLYDTSIENGATLAATREWNVTADLPVVGPNLGLEAITRVPDAFLVARGFFDESKGRTYDPADYPNHEGGLFFVGVEGNGTIYAYALDHVAGTFTRVASFASGYPGIMDISFDAELGQFWAICDDTCQGRSAVLAIDTQAGSPTRGRFTVAQRFERPTGMPNVNNEGFTYAPLSECVNGRRPALWADDNQTGGFALRQGTLTCTAF